MDRLIHLALPRIRDFRGLNPQAFDSQGNFTTRLKDTLMFPETKYEETLFMKPHLDIAIVTSAESAEDGYKLLNGWGMPFRPYDPEEDERIWADIVKREEEEAERVRA